MVTVKEFLNAGRNLQFEIDKLKVLYEKRLDSATVQGVSYEGDRVQQSAGNKTEERYIECSDFAEILANRILELENYRAKMLLLINQYPESIGRSLLIMRYIECIHWDQIAEQLHYDVRWTQRLHGKILEQLQRSHKKPL